MKSVSGDKSHKLVEIERLRGLAVLATVFVHWKFAGWSLPTLLRDPESGVDLFFVISGFVVTSSLLRQLPDVTSAPDFLNAFDRCRDVVRNFYVRRFFRILPAALALVLLQRIAVDLFPNEFGSVHDWEKELVAFLSGIYNFFVVDARGAEKFSVYWSLAVEEQYYLFIPILFIALRTNSRRLGACAIIIVTIALVLRPMGEPPSDIGILWYRLFSSQFRFDSLMAGTALALLWPSASSPPKEPLLPPNLVRYVIVPVVALLIFSLPRTLSEYIWLRTGFMALWALSCVLVAYAAMDRGYVFQWPVVGRALEFLGARSYGLYLVHFSMLRLDGALNSKTVPLLRRYLRIDPAAPWPHFAYLFVATLIVVELLHRGVEKPLMRIGTNVTRQGTERAIPRSFRIGAIAEACAMVLFSMKHAIASVFRPKDLARGASVSGTARASRCGSEDNLVDGRIDEDNPYCTDRGKNPSATIDLGKTQLVGSLMVYNRADGAWDDTLPLEVSIAREAGGDFQTLGTREEVFSAGFPWKLSFNPPIRARQVRLTARGPDRVLGLSEVEIFAAR